jgi:hypothetical protein
MNLTTESHAKSEYQKRKNIFEQVNQIDKNQFKKDWAEVGSAKI